MTIAQFNQEQEKEFTELFLSLKDDGFSVSKLLLFLRKNSYKIAEITWDKAQGATVQANFSGKYEDITRAKEEFFSL